MAIEQEKMQFLGLFGVYKESYKLMFSWRKLLSQITLILIIPLTFNFLIQIELSDFVLGKILHHSNQMTNHHLDTAQPQNLTEIITKEWAIFFLIKIAYFILIFSLYLFSTSAIVYTVASIYTGNKDIAFNKVMSVITNLSKRLMVTFLCTLTAGFFYNIIAMVIAIIFALTFGVRNGGSVAGFIIIGILYFVGLVYLNVVWQLANVVTVLEDSYGFEAMMKSKELIKGKMGLSIFITLQFNFCFFVIRFLFGMLVVNGWKWFELSLMSRITIGFVCFLFLSHLFLLILIMQTVLYFVCKSYQNESIDKCSPSLEHVKVHQGEYVVVV
ncbi:hypothetical protein MtrunA17_Chr3g0125721 [Medicago truncatula]|uniref:Transmembrane protein, putative n=1 Tax=Medicago truncatula TaxID=3880 RepID=A0A072VB70_MEDTR|nr:uncharacterized protein LOC25489750 [Medicago truncatula]KEH35395.1 transmembrane protein, putative [Medicago truncatula]RHN69531.1 hypothetical protein MtrunA17_Chr3g0125721 [Medicago truncatula]